LWWAGQRVLKIQTKLHQWASDDPGRVFADLFNLVTDPAFLMIAWDRVRGNQGARSAGVDGIRPRMIRPVERAFLARLREQIKSGEFTPPGATSRRRDGGGSASSWSGGACVAAIRWRAARCRPRGS
jgi:RNA-directed DNA polymerase